MPPPSLISLGCLSLFSRNFFFLDILFSATGSPLGSEVSDGIDGSALRISSGSKVGKDRMEPETLGSFDIEPCKVALLSERNSSCFAVVAWWPGSPWSLESVLPTA